MYVIVTGATGFIGTNLLQALQNKKVIIAPRKENNKINLYYKGKIIDLNELRKSRVVLVHLATHFSKSPSENREVTNANLNFGNELIERLSTLDIKKIIHTNTMYGYHKDETLRNLHYTQTKIEFSKMLQTFSNNLDIAYDEIYLDNTFGISDKRQKILPIIIKSIKEGSENPIMNPNNSINLMHIGPVIKRIIISIDNENSYCTSFVGKKSINLESLYLYLKNFLETSKINNQSIVYTENNYFKTHPKIDYLDINVENIETSLRRYAQQWK